MVVSIRHTDDLGFHVVYGLRTYRPIMATAFDEGEQVQVRLSHASGSTTYITIQSFDGSVVEDWKATDA